MKILVLSHSCVTSINQQFFAEVEVQTGWEIKIITPTNWKNEYGKILNPKRWESYKGHLQGLPVFLTGNLPLHFYRSTFISILREFAPDVIYVHHEPYGIATVQMYLANKLSINKPIGFFTWQNIFKTYPFPFKNMEKFVLDNTNFAFPGSYSAEEVLRQKKYFGKSVILPAGIDSSLYYPYPSNNEVFEKNNIPKNKFIIGYVGRIIEEKGLKTLLKALHKIKELPWHLIMVGAGIFESEFKLLAEELELFKKIQYIGFVPHSEAPKYLSAFDLLVLPSETRSNWKEQFGRVIIEAMACGTPVIGSDSGEIPFLIQSTAGGLVFPEGNSEVFAEKIKSLILDQDLKNYLACQGKNTVLKQFTNSALATKFSESIETVLISN